MHKAPDKKQKKLRLRRVLQEKIQRTQTAFVQKKKNEKKRK